MNKDTQKISEQKIKGGLYKVLADLFQVLSNPDRIKILRILLPSSPPPELTFSQIMFAIQKNPNTVNYHLMKLSDYGMIMKTEQGKYRITEGGQLALNADSADIIAITEKAIEKGKAEGHIISED